MEWVKAMLLIMKQTVQWALEMSWGKNSSRAREACSPLETHSLKHQGHTHSLRDHTHSLRDHIQGLRDHT